MEKKEPAQKRFDPKPHLIQIKKWDEDNRRYLIKEYLPVEARIIWFRQEHPGWGIFTFPIKLTEEIAIFRASVLNEKREIIATAIKQKTKNGSKDYMEKAETGAIGRALIACGYTLGAAELDDIEATKEIVEKPPVRKVDEKPPKEDIPVEPMRMATESQKLLLLKVCPDFEETHDKKVDDLNFDEAWDEVKDHSEKAAKETKAEMDKIPF